MFRNCVDWCLVHISTAHECIALFESLWKQKDTGQKDLFDSKNVDGIDQTNLSTARNDVKLYYWFKVQTKLDVVKTMANSYV